MCVRGVFRVVPCAVLCVVPAWCSCVVYFHLSDGMTWGFSVVWGFAWLFCCGFCSRGFCSSRLVFSSICGLLCGCFSILVCWGAVFLVVVEGWLFSWLLFFVYLV